MICISGVSERDYRLQEIGESKSCTAVRRYRKNAVIVELIVHQS